MNIFTAAVHHVTTPVHIIHSTPLHLHNNNIYNKKSCYKKKLYKINNKHKITSVIKNMMKHDAARASCYPRPCITCHIMHNTPLHLHNNNISKTPQNGRLSPRPYSGYLCRHIVNIYIYNITHRYIYIYRHIV